MNKFLLFHSDLDSTSALIEGRLLLIDADDHAIANIYLATSGQPSFQTVDGSKVPGKGTIPPHSSAGIPHYTVATKPIGMKGNPGVDGNFYVIAPHMVTLGNGVKRGDFGVHLDANGIDGLKRVGNYAPGSAGCVVLRTLKGWSAFEKDMADLAACGIEEVPLLISYA